MKEQFNHLETIFEHNLTDTPYQEHPRPQFKRDSYLSLNGWWDFFVLSKNGEIKQNGAKILVPFCPESRISGVFTTINKGDLMIYSRIFMLNKSFNKENCCSPTSLRFGI